MSSRLFPVRSFVFMAILFVLLVKLCYTGVLVYTSGPGSFHGFWQSRSALAGNEAQVASEKPLGEQTSKKPGEVSALAAETKNTPEALEIKWKQLEQKEQALAEERKRLAALKEEINQKLLKITKIQKAVRSDLEQKEAVRSGRIKHLIKVYQTMPPRKAAVLVDKLDMDVIIALFSEMKGENVGQILPYVSAEKAAKISERLAKLGL